MLFILSAFFIGLFALIIILAAFQPATFRYERYIVINAPAQPVFAQVNNLVAWGAWSPWAQMDPNTKYSFGEQVRGVGASVSWEGNMQVGKGTSTIIHSDPYSLARLRLDFVKPMKATNTSEFTFDEQNGQTTVTWRMFGPVNFAGKIMALFMNCEKMMHKQFDKGLASLKAVVENRG